MAVLGLVLIAAVGMTLRSSEDAPPFEFISKYGGRKLDRKAMEAFFSGRSLRENVEVYQFDVDIYTLNNAIIDEGATRSTFLNRGKYAHVKPPPSLPEIDPDPAHSYVFVYQSKNWVLQRFVDFQEWVNPRPSPEC
ncbi:MAG: hypothetical protein H7Y17_15725 [Chlorobia bacterium]|nr:hypothetical protein [Fimbriimonadaceae bacterium]